MPRFTIELSVETDETRHFDLTVEEYAEILKMPEDEQQDALEQHFSELGDSQLVATDHFISERVGTITKISDQ